MVIILPILLNLVSSLLQAASPEIVGILKDWLGRYKEELEHVQPGLTDQLDQALASGDVHAVSVHIVQLVERAGALAPEAAGTQAKYTDRLSPG